MSPTLKTSQTTLVLVLMSLMLTTQGATQPGVPQRTQMQSFQSAQVARPKSQMTMSFRSKDRKRIFQGLRSLCMMLREWMYQSALSRLAMISRTSSKEKRYLAWNFVNSCPSSISSIIMQIELSDSYTSQSYIMFGCFNLRKRLIQLMREGNPFSSSPSNYFEKALTATIFLSSRRYARQTEAKFPLPIFLIALKSSWKPRMLSRACRYYLTLDIASFLTAQKILSARFQLSNLKPHISPLNSCLKMI